MTSSKDQARKWTHDHSCGRGLIYVLRLFVMEKKASRTWLLELWCRERAAFEGQRRERAVHRHCMSKWHIQAQGRTRVVVGRGHYDRPVTQLKLPDGTRILMCCWLT